MRGLALSSDASGKSNDHLCGENNKLRSYWDSKDNATMTKEEIEQTRGCNAELIHNSVRFFRSFVFCERDLVGDWGQAFDSPILLDARR